MPHWVEQWLVPSSDGTKTYTVSEAEDGTLACSCPRWTMRRQECSHIRKRHQYPPLSRVPAIPPEFTVSDVHRAVICRRDRDGRVTQVLVPPVDADDHLLLTVLSDLKEMGFGWDFVRRRYRTAITALLNRNPALRGRQGDLTQKAVADWLRAQHGGKSYGAGQPTIAVIDTSMDMDIAATGLELEAPDEEPLPVYNETIRAVW